MLKQEVSAMARVINPTTVIIKEKKVPISEMKHEEGQFEVGPGVHEVKIKTSEEPTEVWLQLDGKGQVPVCLGDVDMAGTVVEPDGFVVHVNVKSTRTTVHWFAYLE